MESIPFTLPDLYASLAEGNGLLRVEEDSLVLEYQVKDSVIGILKSSLKELRIPLREISSIRFVKKLIKSRLFIKTHRMNTLAKFPGSEQGELKLYINRKNRKAAEELVSELELRIAEARLNLLDDEMNALEQ